MPKRSAARRRGPAVRHRPGQWLAAADFKTRCLQLMDRVRETGAEYIVTKHGRPVARLVPYHDDARPRFVGCLRNTVLRYDRPFDPVPAAWNLDRNLNPDDE